MVLSIRATEDKSCYVFFWAWRCFWHWQEENASFVTQKSEFPTTQKFLKSHCTTELPCACCCIHAHYDWRLGSKQGFPFCTCSSHGLRCLWHLFLRLNHVLSRKRYGLCGDPAHFMGKVLHKLPRSLANVMCLEWIHVFSAPAWKRAPLIHEVGLAQDKFF